MTPNQHLFTLVLLVPSSYVLAKSSRDYFVCYRFSHPVTSTRRVSYKWNLLAPTLSDCPTQDFRRRALMQLGGAGVRVLRNEYLHVCVLMTISRGTTLASSPYFRLFPYLGRHHRQGHLGVVISANSQAHNEAFAQQSLQGGRRFLRRVSSWIIL